MNGSSNTSRSSKVSVVSLALALAACAVDQRADVEVWRSEVALGEPVPFEPGQPLALSQAVRLANDANERIAIEGEGFLQAVIARARITAEYLPQVDLVPTFTFRKETDSGTDFLDDATLLDVPVRTQLTVFDGFQRWHRASAVDLTIEERRSLLLDLRETVVLEVVLAYYRVLRAEERVRVLEASLAIQEQRVRETAARQRIGTARTLDVLQTEAQASNTRLELIEARDDIRGGRHALELLTGVDVSECSLHDDFVLPAERPGVDALLAVAQERRQDLRASALGAEAAREEVEVAFGQYYPQVGVSLDWFLARDSLPTERAWNGILALGLPLFAGGRIHADVRAAWSVFRQQVLRYSLLRREIQRDLAVAVDQVVRLDRRLAELATQVRAAGDALRQAEAAYRVGLATNLDRVTAQSVLLQAQLDVVEAELDRKVAWLGMLRITGALTAGTVDVPVPPPPPPRPVPESPFVRVPPES
jgi:outer membrane protein TolC